MNADECGDNVANFRYLALRRTATGHPAGSRLPITALVLIYEGDKT